jgi:hypothetical protein
MPPTHVYTHPDRKGLGQHHAEEAGREHPAEMRDLDMAHGTEVEHVATDEDTGHLIVNWTDLSGHPRSTSAAPDFFAAHFEPLAQVAAPAEQETP